MPLSAVVLAAGMLAETQSPLLQRFTGSWAGRGTWLGKPAAATAAWRPVLGGRFLRLEYRVTPDGASAPAFEGDAYWPLPTGTGGTWFDSQGNVHPLALESRGDAVSVSWGPTGEPWGRTHYRLAPDGRLEIVDEVRAKDGSWRVFAEMACERKQ
jgi:hypothetical protein